VVGGESVPLPADKEAADRALAKMCEQMTEKIGSEKFYTLRNSTLMNIHMADGSWKKKPVGNEQELRLSKVYMGKRGNLIFAFVALDPEWKSVELEQRQIFEAMHPDFESDAVAALGYCLGRISRTALAAGEDGDLACDNFDQAKAKFLLKQMEQSRLEVKKEREIAREAEKAEIEKVMATNPNWGIF
jgi:hypothetical protein